jgi:hypothetical protein
MRSPCFLLLLLGLLAACPSTRSGSGGDDDDSAADDDDVADDDDAANDDDAADDDDTPPDSETDCADGQDEDEDGATDCADSDCDGDPACVEEDCDDGLDDEGDGFIDCDDTDCDSFFPCTWPTSMDHQATFFYDVQGLAALKYDDCTTELVGTVSAPGVTPCDTCDRDYTGLVTYPQDTCSPQFGTTPPGSVSYGIVFDELDPSCFAVYAPDENGNYGDPAGDACDDGTGTFVISRTDPVEVNNFDVGELTTTLRFTPVD